MARENRRLSAALVPQADNAFTELLNLAAELRARQVHLSNADAETLGDLLVAEQASIRDREALVHRVLDILTDFQAEDAGTKPEPVGGNHEVSSASDGLIEDAVVDDFSILEVDLEGLLSEDPDTDMSNSEMVTPSQQPRSTSDVPPFVPPVTPAEEAEEPAWLNLVETTDTPAQNVEQKAYVWPEGVPTHAPVRSLLENFGKTQRVSRDPWDSLNIRENRGGQGFSPMDVMSARVAESVMQPPDQVTAAPTIPGPTSSSGSLLREPVGLPVAQTQDHAGTIESESVDMDSEDTDFSIEQEALGLSPDLLIHESVDSWAIPERVSDAEKPQVENGFLVPVQLPEDGPDTRSSVSTKVVVRDGAHLATAFTIDLSPTGASLEVEHNYPADRQLHLFIELPGGGAISTEAQVRWSHPANGKYLVGLQFHDLSEQARHDLERALS